MIYVTNKLCCNKLNLSNPITVSQSKGFEGFNLVFVRSLTQNRLIKSIKPYSSIDL